MTRDHLSGEEKQSKNIKLVIESSSEGEQGVRGKVTNFNY